MGADVMAVLAFLPWVAITLLLIVGAVLYPEDGPPDAAQPKEPLS